VLLCDLRWMEGEISPVRPSVPPMLHADDDILRALQLNCTIDPVILGKKALALLVRARDRGFMNRRPTQPCHCTKQVTRAL